MVCYDNGGRNSRNFWVFTGLKDTGVLEESEKIVSKALEGSKSVARYCFQR